ncbi:MAG TPA: hypothetical protein VNT81_22705, partial [Vicinamibacterales bacterium]|nr:hypothetical protein [Vicinamibacterales bacterium]
HRPHRHEPVIPRRRVVVIAVEQKLVGTLADQLLLYCYHYDPTTGNYGFVAMRAVRVAGAVTILALVGFVFVSIRRDHRVTGQ